MKRKILMALVVILCFMFSGWNAWAKTCSTSLEVGFNDGTFANYWTMAAGTGKTVQFYIGEKDGKNFTIEKKIKAKKGSFQAYNDRGEKTADIKLKYLDSGKVIITPKDSISEKKSYYIKYTGKKIKFNESNQVYIEVTPSQKYLKEMEKKKVKKLTVKSTSAGNTVTFSKVKYATGYEVYRSKIKAFGFKKIADISYRDFVDFSSLKKGRKYYYKVRAYVTSEGKAYSGYSDIAAVKAEKSFKKATAQSLTKMHLDRHDKSLIKDAHIFGLSDKISFVYSPKNDKEILNNLQYAFIIGDYELGFAYETMAEAVRAKDKVDELLYQKEYDGVYADVFCAYNNIRPQYSIEYENGSYCLYLSMKNARITDKQIFINQKKAVEKVKEVAAQMRAEGKIKEGMSQKEIAEAYYKYIVEADVEGIYFEDSEAAIDAGICMTEDTPYAFFFENQASCLGHTATYNHLLHNEGIKAYGVCNWFGLVEREGHILNYIICDGKEYFTDTTNSLPLMSRKSIEKYVIFCDGEPDRVRKAAGYKAK